MDKKPPWKEAMRGGEMITLYNPDNPDEVVKAVILDEPTEAELELQKSLGLEEPLKPKKSFFKSHIVKGYPALLPKFYVKKGMMVKVGKGLAEVISTGKDGVTAVDFKGKKHGILWKNVRIPFSEKLEK